MILPVSRYFNAGFTPLIYATTVYSLGRFPLWVEPNKQLHIIEDSNLVKVNVYYTALHMYRHVGCVTFHTVCVRAHVCEVIFPTLLGQGLSLLAKPFLFLPTAVSPHSLYFIYLHSEYSIAGLCASVCVFSSLQHKLIIFIRPAVVPQTTGQISQSFHRLKYRFEK